MPLLTIRSFIIIAIISGYISIEPVTSLRNQLRTVERCDTKSIYLHSLSDANSCILHCEKTYISADKLTKDSNKNLAQFYLKQDSNGRQECCCKFNAVWPAFVNPKAIGREFWERFKIAKAIDCLPLLISVRLSERTTRSYNRLCHYLNKREPLTLLELMNFARDAAYLNFVRPKHPFLIKTIKLKEVSRINQETLTQLEEALDQGFLDSWRPLENFDGYHLASDRLKEFYSIKKYSLNEAVKSPIVAKAYDEYVISYILMDVGAASLYIEGVNKISLRIANSLLEGDFDKYDPSSKATYFTMNNLDCHLLRKTRSKLSSYLSILRTTLDSLYEKLIYDHMTEKYKPLIKLVDSETLYKNLEDVNCKSMKSRSF